MPATHDDSTDPQSEAGYSSYQSSERRWTTDDDLRRERLNDQVGIILECLDGCEVHLDNGGPDDSSPTGGSRTAVPVPSWSAVGARRRCGPGRSRRATRLWSPGSRQHPGTDRDGNRRSATSGTSETHRRSHRLPPSRRGRHRIHHPADRRAAGGRRGHARPRAVCHRQGRMLSGHRARRSGGRPARSGYQHRSCETSGAGVLVSVVDTGLLIDVAKDKDHPWLAARVAGRC